MWHPVDEVELRFRASKGDQCQNGTVVTRSYQSYPKDDSGLQLGAVDFMLELLSYAPKLPRRAPLVAYQLPYGK